MKVSVEKGKKRKKIGRRRIREEEGKEEGVEGDKGEEEGEGEAKGK